MHLVPHRSAVFTPQQDKPSMCKIVLLLDMQDSDTHSFFTALTEEVQVSQVRLSNKVTKHIASKAC